MEGGRKGGLQVSHSMTSLRKGLLAKAKEHSFLTF